MLCGSLDGRGVWGRMDTCLCMAGSLCCSGVGPTWNYHNVINWLFSSVQSFSRVWLLQPHGLQHAKPPCPSLTPRVYSNSCPLSQWCHPTISSSHPLLLLPSIFSSIRVFSNESVLCIRCPKYWSFSFNISPSNEYSGLISFRMDWWDLLAIQGTLKSLLQHHSSKASILRHSAFFRRRKWQPTPVFLPGVSQGWGSLVGCRLWGCTVAHDWSDLAAAAAAAAFFIVQLSHPYMTTAKTIALTRRTFVGKVMSLLFNMLSRLVITFLPRSKRLLISWHQSPSAVILEPRKIKSDTVSTVSPSISHEVMGLDWSFYIFLLY